MRSFVRACALLPLFAVALVGSGFAQPPNHFALYQNDPNPFCGWTRIDYALPQQVVVDLSIWNPDSTMVIRTLVTGVQLAGYYSILWDGRDQGGVLLPDGSYPYVLTARAEPGIPPLFAGSFRATIGCATPIESRSWGSVKALYRDPIRLAGPPR